MFGITAVAQALKSLEILNIAGNVTSNVTSQAGSAACGANPLADQIQLGSPVEVMLERLNALSNGQNASQGVQQKKRKRGGFLKRAFKGIKNAFKGVSNAFKSIAKPFQKLFDVFKQATSGLSNLLKNPFEALKGLLPNLTQLIPGAGILGGLTQGLNLFKGLFGNH